MFDATGVIDFSVGDFRESSLSIRFIAGGTGATAIFPGLFQRRALDQIRGLHQIPRRRCGRSGPITASGFGSVSTAGFGCAHPGTVNASPSPTGSANPHTNLPRKPIFHPRNNPDAESVHLLPPRK